MNTEKSIEQEISADTFNVLLDHFGNMDVNVGKDCATIYPNKDAGKPIAPEDGFKALFNSLPSIIWFVNPLAVMLMMTVSAFGQSLAPPNQSSDGGEAKSTIMVGEFLSADMAILSPREDGRVDIFVSNLDEFSRFVATVDVPYKSPIVRAFDVTAVGYRPVLLTPTKTPGKFTLDQPGTWAIEVWGTDNGIMKIDLFNDIVIPNRIVEPDDPIVIPPVDPVPVPELSNLTALTKATMDIVGDRVAAEKYLDGLRMVNFEGDMSAVITSVQDVRKELLVGVVTGKWYKFFQMVDDEFSGVENTEDLKRHWEAVMVGIAEYLNEAPELTAMGTIPQTVFEPIEFSNEPVYHGTIRGDYQYQQICDPAGGPCRNGWIKIK